MTLHTHTNRHCPEGVGTNIYRPRGVEGCAGFGSGEVSCCLVYGRDGSVAERQTMSTDRILKNLVWDLCFGWKTSDRVLERI